MEWIKLSLLECFKASDPKTGQVYYGHDQDWYKHWFKRLAGCGPTTGANILLYNTLVGSLFDNPEKRMSYPLKSTTPAKPKSLGIAAANSPAGSPSDGPISGDFPVVQDASLQRMEIMWQYVRPAKRGGVYSTEKFCEGIRNYCRSFGYGVVLESLDVPQVKSDRPSTAATVDFISISLRQNRAVAFLNLDNGSEKQLEKWHWVTIVGIYVKDNDVRLEILDNCTIFQLDLNSWLKTTVRGGGFVRFYFMAGERISVAP